MPAVPAALTQDAARAWVLGPGAVPVQDTALGPGAAPARALAPGTVPVRAQTSEAQRQDAAAKARAAARPDDQRTTTRPPLQLLQLLQPPAPIPANYGASRPPGWTVRGAIQPLMAAPIPLLKEAEQDEAVVQ